MLLSKLQAYAVMLAVVAAAVSAAYYTVWHNGYDAGAAQTLVRWQQQAALAQRTADAASAAMAVEHQQKTDLTQEINRVANQQRSRASDDARAAELSHKLLLDAARSACTASGGAAAAPASATPSSTPASSAYSVYADVLARLDVVAGDLAAALDQSRAAGLACERWADEVAHQK
jgi:hypothetical protein